VANFIGRANLIPGTAPGTVGDDGLLTVETPFGTTISALAAPRCSGRVSVAIRPEHVRIAPSENDATSGRGGADRLAGAVTRKIFMGWYIQYHVSVGEIEIVAKMSATDTDVPIGAAVTVTWAPGCAYAIKGV
ncbi:MAG: TOBE domain-containing protein, partial [Zavarzinia sp.]|nr:TOBE domain-containing protein [Zavarzinia sp.]